MIPNNNTAFVYALILIFLTAPKLVASECYRDIFYRYSVKPCHASSIICGERGETLKLHGCKNCHDAETSVPSAGHLSYDKHRCFHAEKLAEGDSNFGDALAHILGGKRPPSPNDHFAWNGEDSNNGKKCKPCNPNHYIYELNRLVKEMERLNKRSCLCSCKGNGKRKHQDVEDDMEYDSDDENTEDSDGKNKKVAEVYKKFPHLMSKKPQPTSKYERNEEDESEDEGKIVSKQRKRRGKAGEKYKLPPDNSDESADEPRRKKSNRVRPMAESSEEDKSEVFPKSQSVNEKAIFTYLKKLCKEYNARKALENTPEAKVFSTKSKRTTTRKVDLISPENEEIDRESASAKPKHRQKLCHQCIQKCLQKYGPKKASQNIHDNSDVLDSEDKKTVVLDLQKMKEKRMARKKKKELIEKQEDSEEIIPADFFKEPSDAKDSEAKKTEEGIKPSEEKITDKKTSKEEGAIDSKPIVKDSTAKITPKMEKEPSEIKKDSPEVQKTQTVFLNKAGKFFDFLTGFMEKCLCKNNESNQKLNNELSIAPSSFPFPGHGSFIPNYFNAPPSPPYHSNAFGPTHSFPSNFASPPAHDHSSTPLPSDKIPEPNIKTGFESDRPMPNVEIPKETTTSPKAKKSTATTETVPPKKQLAITYFSPEDKSAPQQDKNEPQKPYLNLFPDDITYHTVDPEKIKHKINYMTMADLPNITTFFDNSEIAFLLNPFKGEYDLSKATQSFVDSVSTNASNIKQFLLNNRSNNVNVVLPQLSQFVNKSSDPFLTQVVYPVMQKYSASLMIPVDTFIQELKGLLNVLKSCVLNPSNASSCPFNSIEELFNAFPNIGRFLKSIYADDLHLLSTSYNLNKQDLINNAGKRFFEFILYLQFHQIGNLSRDTPYIFSAHIFKTLGWLALLGKINESNIN